MPTSESACSPPKRFDTPPTRRTGCGSASGARRAARGNEEPPLFDAVFLPLDRFWIETAAIGALVDNEQNA